MAVRRESVRLDMDGNYASVAAGNAAATQILARRVRALDRAYQGLNTSSAQASQNFGAAPAHVRATTQSTDALGRSARNTDRSINQLTGRLGAYADAALILGPGLIPIAAVGATAIGGLAAAATGLALAGTTAIVAFQGVGDAVKAANEYAIDPSAENLDKYRETLRQLGPAAADFVRHYAAIRPMLREMRDAAAEGLFPGLTASLDDFERVAPRAAELLNLVGTELGEIVADSAESLAGPRWVGFLGYLRDEMPGVVRSLSTIMGDLSHGTAELIHRLDPANDRFLGWVGDVADGFDRWASSSEGRDDLRAFMEYFEENGAEVRGLAESLVGALASIVSAGAPLGGPVLVGLTAVTDLLGAVAESDAATPLLAAYAAFRLYVRGAALAEAAQNRLNAAQQRAGLPGAAGAAGRGAGAGAAPFGPMTSQQAAAAAAARRAQRMQRLTLGAQGAALAGLVALTSTDLGDMADDAGASNTAMLTLMGTMLAPGWGTAAGLVAGSLLDIASANDKFVESADAARLALDGDDLTSAAQNIGRARAERDKLMKDQRTWSVFSPGDSAGDLIQNGLSLFGKSQAQDAQRQTRELEDLYRAQYKISRLKPTSSYAGFNDLFGGLTGKITPTTNALNDFVAAMRSADEFLGYRANLVSYEEAWDNIRASIKENGKTLDATTEKGRANITALDGLANTGKQFAESLTGTKRGTFLRRLARDIRAAAGEFDMSKQQVDDYLEKLGLLDTKRVKPKADLDSQALDSKTQRALRRLQKLGASSANPFADLYTGQFDSALGQAKSDLAMFDGSTATAVIKVRREIDNFFAAGGFNGKGSADGGTVPSTGLPYADRHPYLLADEEEVISNRYGQAARRRRLLKGVNRNASDAELHRLIGLADGGTAGAQLRAADEGRYQSSAARPAGSGGGSQVVLNLRDLKVRGVIDTPWGPQQIQEMMVETARAEIADERRFQDVHGG